MTDVQHRETNGHLNDRGSHKSAKEESNVERTRVCGIKRTVEIFFVVVVV